MLKSIYYLLIKIGLLRKECIFFTNGKKLTRLYFLSLPFLQFSRADDPVFQEDLIPQNSRKLKSILASRMGGKNGPVFDK